MAKLRTMAALAGVFGLVACAGNLHDVPHTYLLQARQAVANREAPAAIAALDKAEQEFIANNAPYSLNPMMTEAPESLREIARARQSVQMQRWGDASYYINAALRSPYTITPGLN